MTFIQIKFMPEENWKRSWKGRIAEQIVSSYKKGDCIMSKHIFNTVITKELLWHATTMIKGNKVNRTGNKVNSEGGKAKEGDYVEAMVNIKIVGQRYWSKEAKEQYNKNNPEDSTGYKNSDGLIHEHAVPRIMIKTKIEETLEENQKANEEEKINKVYKIIDKYSKSVIITKEEDKKIYWGKTFTKDGKKWAKIDSDFEDKFKEEGQKFIEFMKNYRYKDEGNKTVVNEIIDLGEKVPYDKNFKKHINKKWS